MTRPNRESPYQYALVAALPDGSAFTQLQIIESVHEPVNWVHSTGCRFLVKL